MRKRRQKKVQQQIIQPILNEVSTTDEAERNEGSLNKVVVLNNHQQIVYDGQEIMNQDGTYS